MATKPQLAVGLDVGSSRTRVVACAVEDGHLRYLSHGLAPSGGWNKGRIVDGQAVADSIAAALADAERDAGITIESATIGIGGAGVQGAQGFQGVQGAQGF